MSFLWEVNTFCFQHKQIRITNTKKGKTVNPSKTISIYLTIKHLIYKTAHSPLKLFPSTYDFLFSCDWETCPRCQIMSKDKWSISTPNKTNRLWFYSLAVRKPRNGRYWTNRETTLNETCICVCSYRHVALCCPVCFVMQKACVSKRDCLAFQTSIVCEEGIGRDITDDGMTFSTMMPSWDHHSRSNTAGRNVEPLSCPPHFLLDVQDTHLTSERDVWEKACVLKSTAMNPWEMHLPLRAVDVCVINTLLDSLSHGWKPHIMRNSLRA